ncbi:site-specific DNA-methyltransferase [Candidatus Saccharibacteria bacterium]|nr:site-specific DNA-methyltransferase [Candidatus Saccharibacteria bacterium]
MNKSMEILAEVLGKNENLVVDGMLDKNMVAELARKYDKGLLTALCGDKNLKKLFFEDIDGQLVFKNDIFLQFISQKEFLPDSYTKFSQTIGLATANGDLLSSDNRVVLNWPYKDCVLEGGQTKEDAKRDEVFFNEILAPDEINTILEDKVFTNWKRYDKDGEHELDGLKPNDNLVIKGNNLVVLHSLKKRFAGKVNLIYIDPPYNTGNDSFKYNDHFNHSTWLTFMKNRLEVAKDLLAQDGSIFVQLDYNEVHYCKILMDEIFGANNFQREIIWTLGGLAGYKSLANNFIRGHDTILFYSKSPNFKFNKTYLPYDEKQLKRFTTGPDGRKYKTLAHGRKLYLEDAKGIPLSDVWTDIASFQTVVNSPEIAKDFDGQKPEKLLKRIIESVTDEGDLVLDYHLGTGTTAVVANKMNRRYIGIEQLDYGETDSVKRLEKCVMGTLKGYGEFPDWQGGGSFVYCNIKNDANIFREKVASAKEADLSKLLDEVLKSSFLSYRVDPKKANKKEFEELSLADKKRILCSLVDNNTLYMNYSEIDDASYDNSAEDKKFNKQFYTEIDQYEF